MDDDTPPFIALAQSVIVRHLVAALAAQIVLLATTAHKIFAAGGLTVDNVETAIEAVIQIAGIGFTGYALFARVSRPTPTIKLTKASADAANTAVATAAITPPTLNPEISK